MGVETTTKRVLSNTRARMRSRTRPDLLSKAPKGNCVLCRRVGALPTPSRIGRSELWQWLTHNRVVLPPESDTNSHFYFGRAKSVPVCVALQFFFRFMAASAGRLEVSSVIISTYAINSYAVYVNDIII